MRIGPLRLSRPTPPSFLPRQPTSGAGVVLASLLALAAACGAVRPAAAVRPGAPPGAADEVAAEAGRRADAATEALVRAFWSPDARAFLVAPGGAPAQYWVAAQAYDAVLDAVERSGGRRFADVAQAFVAGQDARGWVRDFFDDECWMVLALLRASDLTGDRGALARAEALLDDVMTNGADPAGGVWWDREHTQKATAANAGAVVAAARLYERTGEARRLAFAERAFAYWLARMVDPARGRSRTTSSPPARRSGGASPTTRGR